MIASSDYKHYFSDNQALINNLKNNKFVLYERFKDVIYSLDFIAENYEKYEHHESGTDFEDIFEIGFSYFHSEFEQIKIYYEEYFKKDIILLKKYDLLINLVPNPFTCSNDDIAKKAISTNSFFGFGL